jgi:hypothetical protein
MCRICPFYQRGRCRLKFTRQATFIREAKILLKNVCKELHIKENFIFPYTILIPDQYDTKQYHKLLQHKSLRYNKILDNIPQNVCRIVTPFGKVKIIAYEEIYPVLREIEINGYKLLLVSDFIKNPSLLFQYDNHEIPYLQAKKWLKAINKMN